MYLTWSANQATMKFCADVPCDGDSGGVGCPCAKADYSKYYIAAVLYGLTDCAFQTVASAVCAQDFVASGLAVPPHLHLNLNVLNSNALLENWDAGLREMDMVVVGRRMRLRCTGRSSRWAA